MTTLPMLDWRHAFPEPIIRQPVIERKAPARITIPAPAPGVTIYPSKQSSTFRTVVKLGTVATISLPFILVLGEHGYSMVQPAVDTITSASLPAAVEVAAPVAASSDNEGWDMFIKKVLWIVDYLMDGVIIFSGVSWMFGNRTKAIELLLGAGVGYVIVRHYEDIKNFFALL